MCVITKYLELYFGRRTSLRPSFTPFTPGGAVYYLSLLAFISIVLFAFATHFSGSIFGPEICGEAFDSLAVGMLDGRSDVDPKSIKGEAFRIGGKTYMYFGPFPAILRIVLHQIWPKEYGKFSRFSVLLASILAMFYFMSICLESCRVNGRIVGWIRRIFVGALVLGFVLGTPLLFIASAPLIYHESMIWGVAWTIVFISYFQRFLDPVRYSLSGSMVGMSISAGLAILSRVTFGLPCIMIFTIIALRQLYVELKNKTWKIRLPKVQSAALIGLPLILCLALQSWYNYSRFGSMLTFIDMRYYSSNSSARSVKPLVEFDVERIPVAVRNYFTPRTEHITSNFPYFTLAQVKHYGDKRFELQKYKEWTLPLGIGSAWLLAFFVGALVMLCRRRPSLLHLAIIAFVGQAVLILSYFFITQRYSAEFLPLAVVSIMFVIRETRIRSPIFGYASSVFLGILISISISATVGSTISWLSWSNNWMVPNQQIRKELSGIVAKLDGTI